MPSLQHQSSTPSSHLAFPTSHLSLTSLIQDKQQMVKGFLHDTEPSSYEKASLDPPWQAPMTSEFEALYANET